MKKISLFFVSFLVILAVIIPFYLKTSEFSRQTQLKRFSSYEELKNFLKVSMGQAKQFENISQFPFLRGGEIEAFSSDAKAAYESAPEH
ncbi:MAG: hypothetical protein OEX10_04570, partial [Candidatus Bathyarchaeota archaeon]|nr:hypothetical protein [Candidatus Bathyarchaeota archaeon]